MALLELIMLEQHQNAVAGGDGEYREGENGGQHVHTEAVLQRVRLIAGLDKQCRRDNQGIERKHHQADPLQPAVQVRQDDDGHAGRANERGHREQAKADAAVDNSDMPQGAGMEQQRQGAQPQKAEPLRRAAAVQLPCRQQTGKQVQDSGDQTGPDCGCHRGPRTGARQRGTTAGLSVSQGCSYLKARHDDGAAPWL